MSRSERSAQFAEAATGVFMQGPEEDGVVRRVSYDEVPPRVEYALTGDGARLNEALEPLAAWGRERATGPAEVNPGT